MTKIFNASSTCFTRVTGSSPLLALLALAVFFSACRSSERRFVVEGDIKDMPQQTVVLEQLNANDIISIVDSVKSERNGKFTITANAPEQGLYRLHFKDNSFILLSVDKGTIKITADWATIEKYSVAGSPGSESLKQFIVQVRNHLRDFNTMSLVMDSLKAQGKDSVYAVAKKDFEDMRLAFTGFVEHYADTVRYEPNAIFAARLLNSSSEGEFIGTFAQTLEHRFAGTRMTREFMEYYHNKLNSKQHPTDEPSGGHVDVGFDAPDITMKTPDGNELSLSSLKGKYILVHFWASWQPQSMQENPNLKKAYQDYKGKNFTIFAVSLDNQVDVWKKVIDSEKLNWYHVSDLRGMNSGAAKLYGVTTLPFNFLVDPKGKVIARDLRGAQLSDILRQFIKPS